ncbi:MAG: hypothetical protein IH892_07820, partial [Planctomycetes bacterium]|nr:hypothetical protein [Planctomycetota bacterium]
SRSENLKQRRRALAALVETHTPNLAPLLHRLLDEPELQITGKRLLVIASSACSLAFETACRLAPDNDVTLVCEEQHDHPSGVMVDCDCVQVGMAGNISFIPSTKVTAVRGGDVYDVDSAVGRQKVQRSSPWSGLSGRYRRGVCRGAVSGEPSTDQAPSVTQGSPAHGD